MLVDFAKYLSLFLMYKPTFQALSSNAVFKNQLLLLDLIWICDVGNLLYASMLVAAKLYTNRGLSLPLAGGSAGLF